MDAYTPSSCPAIGQRKLLRAAKPTRLRQVITIVQALMQLPVLDGVDLGYERSGGHDRVGTVLFEQRETSTISARNRPQA
jgi:hypothetical protein